MTTADETGAGKPLMGIGACLAGQAVRYNGQSKAASQHVRSLMEHFEVRPFCPEMGIGLGTPRPPIHLVGSAENVRVLDVATHQHDYTDPIKAYARSILDREPWLCGYILVKGSPSCGWDRVKRFTQKGLHAASDQKGIFAAALADFEPLLPLEDDGRLNDPGLRESFLTRACAYHEWKKMIAGGLTQHKLIRYYSRYKYQVMAHHVPSYKALGRLLSGAGNEPLEALSKDFIQQLMTALKRRATRRSHSNVLFHLAGYLKRKLSSSERRRLADLIDMYRTGQVPLVVPLTMLRHHFANNPNPYIDSQVFLLPSPEKLSVQNLI